MHLRHKLWDAERLCDHLIHASLNRTRYLLGPCVRGDRNHRYMAADLATELLLPDVPNASQAVHGWHFQIEEDNGKRCLRRTEG